MVEKCYGSFRDRQCENDKKRSAMEIKEKTEETAKKTRMMKTVEDSKTEQVHLIMHQHLNAGGRLFGGMLMQWVDEVSGVVAMRHCGTYRVTTAAVDNLQFKEPVYEGEILVMIGYVTYVGNTSMEVEIDSYVERGDGMRYLVNRAFSVPSFVPAVTRTDSYVFSSISCFTEDACLL